MSQIERFESTTPLESYSVENAIKIVRELADGLITSTAHAKHHFRSEWVDQLVSRYGERPGKPVVHLSDLRESVMPILGMKARRFVEGPYYRLVEEHGARRAEWAFRNIGLFVLKKGNRPAKLRTWKMFAEMTGFHIDSIEPFVSALKLSGGNRMRTVHSPHLPIHLATPAGGKLLGYRLDSNYSNSAFTNKNPLLHEDYRRAVTEIVGDIGITETRYKGSGFKPDSYLRTNVGNLVSTMMTVAGLDNTREQRAANSPAPLWLFVCPLEVIESFLAALWDAEGSVNKRDVKLRQAVFMSSLDSNLSVPSWPDSVHFGELDQHAKNQLFDRPPRILTSTALLLRRLGITCHVNPERVSNTRQGLSVYWYLRIMTNNSVRAFHCHVKLLSAEKQKILDRNVESMKWQWRRRS